MKTFKDIPTVSQVGMPLIVTWIEILFAFVNKQMPITHVKLAFMVTSHVLMLMSHHQPCVYVSHCL